MNENTKPQQPDWLIRDNLLYQEMNPDPVQKANDAEFQKFIEELENG